MSKKFLIIIHNRSTYDNHFIIKQLPEEFEGQFKCLGENAEKYITFSVPVKKDVAKDDDNYDDDDNYVDGGEKRETSECRLSFVDSYRLMLSKLSELGDNLSGIFNAEYMKCMKRKNIKSECYYKGLRNNRLHYKCKECREPRTKSINDPFRKFPIFCQFCKGVVEKIFLLLEKVLILMNAWIVGKNLAKLQYRLKKLFTAN